MKIIMDLTMTDPVAIQKKLEQSCCEGKMTYECQEHFLTPGLKAQFRESVLSDKKGNSANVLAELCKYDTCREYLFDESILTCLIKNLETKDVDLVRQSCRALANLCYDMESARTVIVEKGGLDAIIKLLKLPPNDLIASNIPLRAAIIGLLLNVITDNEECHKQVMSSGLPDKLLVFLRAELDAKQVTTLSQHIILVLVTLAESVSMEDVFKLPVCQAAVEMLDACQESTFTIPALAFLDIATVPDVVKHRLVQAGLFDFLLKRLEQQPKSSTNEEENANLEMIGRVLCNLLTGDEAMNYVYNKYHPTLLQKLTDWLKDGQYNLMYSSALCIGNIARTDAHSKEVVSRGIHKIAVDVLKRDNCDMKLQHAVLSTLRNLAILKENKKILIADGILDVLMPLVSLNILVAPQVIFKLVGTWRQLVDGEKEVAIRLGGNKQLLEQLVTWSDAANCAWVSSESLRLLCSLTTVSRDLAVTEALLKAKAFGEITKLLTSHHQVMQMEAVNALTVAGALLNNSNSEWDTALINAMVGEKLKILFETPDITVQLLENVITMLGILNKSDKLKRHLQDAVVPDALENIINTNEPFSKLKPKFTNLKNTL